MSNQTLDQASIGDWAEALDRGEVSAVELARAHLERIDAHDSLVNAVIERNPQAEEIAERCDRERAAGATCGPLHGIPLLVKDNIDTGDRMMTTAGSLALEGSRAASDAGVVAALRAAGAVILGKTNLSEWANFRSRRSSSGWSSRGGQTRNAYALDRSPGGSSSGSAVAVSAGFCAAAIGTETDGSIVSPAAMNAIVGIKPTLGLVAGDGIIPIAHSQDTAGPMARTVADAARVLEAITVPARQPAGFAEALRPDGLKARRIGVARSYAGFDDAVDAILETALEACRAAGAQIIDEIPLAPVEDFRDDERTVMRHEFKAGLDAYLAGLGPDAPVRSLDEVIAFNAAHADRVMPYFGQDILEAAAPLGPLSEPGYQEALARLKRMSREEGLDALLAQHELDAIVAPSTCTPWLIDWVNGDNRSGGSACPAAVAGYPNITVPAGWRCGLPVGLSFFAGAYRERTLIEMAYAFEQATSVRTPPTFRSSIELPA